MILSLSWRIPPPRTRSSRPVQMLSLSGFLILSTSLLNTRGLLLSWEISLLYWFRLMRVEETDHVFDLRWFIDQSRFLRPVLSRGFALRVTSGRCSVRFQDRFGERVDWLIRGDTCFLTCFKAWILSLFWPKTVILKLTHLPLCKASILRLHFPEILLDILLVWLCPRMWLLLLPLFRSPLLWFWMRGARREILHNARIYFAVKISLCHKDLHLSHLFVFDLIFKCFPCLSCSSSTWSNEIFILALFLNSHNSWNIVVLSKAFTLLCFDCLFR